MICIGSDTLQHYKPHSEGIRLTLAAPDFVVEDVAALQRLLLA